MQATTTSPSTSNNSSSSVPQWIWVVGAVIALTATGVASALAWQSASRPAAPQPLAAVEAPVAAAPAAAIAPPAPVAPPVTAPAAPRVAQAPIERSAPAPAVCHNCGVVESVQAVKVKGDGSGVGAVAGGVLGGVVGNQFGKGNGRAAMTVLGAVGGGFAGNETEKHIKATTVYSVRVRMDDGSLRTVQQAQAPATGARVQVDGSTLRGV